MARRCIRYGRGKGGRRVCRKYAGKARRRRGYGLLPLKAVAGTKCVRMKRTRSGVKRCASYKFRRKGQRGIWREAYDRAGWDLGKVSTQGMKCKGFKAVGRACKPRCAGYKGKKVGAKTPTAARAACKRRKGGGKKRRRR